MLCFVVFYDTFSKGVLGQVWHLIVEALPGVMGNRGNRAFISGEQRSNFEGNRGTKTILGNREHKKTNFQFLENRGTSQFISGEQGNRYPLGRPHCKKKTNKTFCGFSMGRNKCWAGKGLRFACLLYDGSSRRLNRKWFYGEAGNQTCDPWFTRHSAYPLHHGASPLDCIGD